MTLRVGLVGCGRMGCFTSDKFRENSAPGWLPLSHAEAVRAVDGLELCALCDVNAESLERAGAAYPEAARYADFREMIEREKPDILCVATRTAERPEIVRFAAGSGVRAIHIEKPLARSLGECLGVVEALTANGTLISHGTYRRYHGLYRRALDMVSGGDLGELREIGVEMDRALLFWTHPHSIDLMLMFAGGRTPELVWGDMDFDPANLSGDTLDQDPFVRHGYVRFSDGLTAAMGQTGGLNLRLGGSEGVLEIERDGAAMRRRTFADRRTEDLGHFNGPSGTMGALMELRDGLLSGAPCSFGPAELEMNTRLLLCMAYASVVGRPVEPGELPENFLVTGRFGQWYA